MIIIVTYYKPSVVMIVMIVELSEIITNMSMKLILSSDC